MSSTQQRLRMLERYRVELSLVHPSRIHVWEHDRVYSAVVCIQNWWRRYADKHRKPDQLKGHVRTNVRNHEQLQIAVDKDAIAETVLLRMTKLEYVDFDALDIALAGYYKARRHQSTGISKPTLELDAVENILNNWDGMAFTPDMHFGNSRAHDAMLKQVSTPWWHRVPDKDADLDDWLSEIEQGTVCS